MLFLAALLPVACSNNKTDYDASGIFESTEVIVSSQVSGQLMEFTVTEGQQLQADSYLGYVDTTQLYLKKQQLMASRTAVSSRSTSVPRQIASLKEQIATQKRELARFGNLVKLNAANQKQVDDIQSQLSVLEKQLAAQTELLVNNNQGISGESTALESQIAQIEDHFLTIVIATGHGIIDGGTRSIDAVGTIAEADDGVGHAVGIGGRLAYGCTSVVFHHAQYTGFAVCGLAGALGIAVEH